jgi:galactoside O-acetyltransferase
MMLGESYYTERELMAAGFRRLGRNVKIHRRASIYGTENIAVGDHVRIDDFTVIVATGPLELGNYVNIMNHCFIGSRYGIVLEDFVGLAHGSKLFTSVDDFSGGCLTGPTVPPEMTGGKKGPIVFRRHAVLCAGGIVLPCCTIEEGSVVGALSLVKNDLEPWGIYGGVPAVRLKERRRDLLALEQRLRSEAA